MDEEQPRTTLAGFSNYPRQAERAATRSAGVHLSSIPRGFELATPGVLVWIGSFIVSWSICVSTWILLAGGFDFLKYATFDLFPSMPLVVEVTFEVLVNLLIWIFIAGALKMGVKQARRERIRVRDIFAGFRHWSRVAAAFPVFIAQLLIGNVGGAVFLPLLIVDQDMPLAEATRRAYRAFKGERWRIAGLVGLSALIGLAGFGALLVGLIFTVPAFFVMIGFVYDSFYPKAQNAPPELQPIGLEPPR